MKKMLIALIFVLLTAFNGFALSFDGGGIVELLTHGSQFLAAAGLHF